VGSNRNTSGARYFAQDCRALGAGRCGEIGGAIVNRLESQHGEGEGFFCVLRNPETTRGDDLDSGEAGPEMCHEQRVVGATAGDDHIIDAKARRDPSVQRIENGERGEQRCCVEHVFRSQGVAIRPEERSLDEGGTELFAACGFWRLFAEEGIPPQGSQ